VLPGGFRRLCDLALDGSTRKAGEWDARMHGVYEFLGVEPNPIPVKAILALQGIGHGLRLPLQPLSTLYQDDAAAMHAVIRDIENDCRDSLAA
jgi:4-hydroxy-tetrahydrodipicolinate synthase